MGLEEGVPVGAGTKIVNPGVGTDEGCSDGSSVGIGVEC